jgi:hypothetical protein
MDAARPVTADPTPSQPIRPLKRLFGTMPFFELGFGDAFFLPIDRYPNSLKENRVSHVIKARSGFLCTLFALTPRHDLL